MRSWLLSALKKRFQNATFEMFAAEHGHDWLIWEPGSWLPPSRVTMAGSLDKPQNPSKSGEALAIALEQSAGTLILGREGSGPGSNEENEIVLNDGTLSKKHLQFESERPLLSAMSRACSSLRRSRSVDSRSVSYTRYA